MPKGPEERSQTRVLIAIEDEYRVYGGVLAAGLRTLRPDTEVVAVGLDVLGEEITRFDPRVVVCSRPNTVNPGGRSAWIEISTNPVHPAKVCLGGHRYVRASATLDALIAVIEQVETLSRAGSNPCGC